VDGAGEEEGEAPTPVGAAGEEEEPRGGARHGRDLMSFRPARTGRKRGEEGKESGGGGV
jgi:hypothetical protein